jgi:hypothetical protein
MNKGERFNRFTQFIAFGGHGLIAENDRDEQRKRVKRTRLVANRLILHNAWALTGQHQPFRNLPPQVGTSLAARFYSTRLDIVKEKRWRRFSGDFGRRIFNINAIFVISRR